MALWCWCQASLQSPPGMSTMRCQLFSRQYNRIIVLCKQFWIRESITFFCDFKLIKEQAAQLVESGRRRPFAALQN